MKISKPWFGLILLPVVSSIAGKRHATRCFSVNNLSIECITAVNVSVKDQLTLSISVAIGSALVRHFR
jgi:Ca2+:H+ antiporter